MSRSWSKMREEFRILIDDRSALELSPVTVIMIRAHVHAVQCPCVCVRIHTYTRARVARRPVVYIYVYIRARTYTNYVRIRTTYTRTFIIDMHASRAQIKAYTYTVNYGYSYAFVYVTPLLRPWYKHTSNSWLLTPARSLSPPPLPTIYYLLSTYTPLILTQSLSTRTAHAIDRQLLSITTPCN